MNIRRFYTETIQTTRMVWANESSAQTVVGSFAGHVQQAMPEYEIAIGNALGKTYNVWCEHTTDVEPGDSLTIASGNFAGTYNVQNILQNSIGPNKHLQLTVVKDVL